MKNKMLFAILIFICFACGSNSDIKSERKLFEQNISKFELLKDKIVQHFDGRSTAEFEMVTKHWNVNTDLYDTVRSEMEALEIEKIRIHFDEQGRWKELEFKKNERFDNGTLYYKTFNPFVNEKEYFSADYISLNTKYDWILVYEEW